MRHVSRTHRVALDWLFDRINLDSKIQIKFFVTKNQLADSLTKGNFTRDEWNHLLCLFNISHFSFTVCSEAMEKDHKQDSGEERVTAKPRPMMSLIARAPSNISSSTSESRGKRSYGNQNPWSAKAERGAKGATRCDTSKRSKATAISHWKTMKTELEMSVESRSFFNRVNDQVRKRQKRSSMNVTEDGEKHSMILGMFMSVTMESAVFMGKNYLDNCHSIAKLVSEQSDEISGLEAIGCENHSWKYLSLIGDERVINLQRTKVYVFSDSVLCLGKIHENPQSNDAWEQRLGWLKSSSKYRNFDRIDG